MINADLSYFDAAVVGVILLSCLFAFFRGFVKEILSLGAWVGAGILTIYLFPAAAVRLEPSFKSPIVAAGIATLGIYITALLFFTLINMVILKYMRDGSDVGFLDNSLGLFFGAFRGAFIVSLGYLLLTIPMRDDDQPEWVRDAKTRPYVEEGAILLAKAAPDYLRRISSLNAKIEGNKAPAAGDKHPLPIILQPEQQPPEEAT